MSKEIDVSIKEFNMKMVPDLNIGFGGQSGNWAMMNRFIFNDFFFYDNIKSLQLPMDKIFDAVLENQISDYGVNKDSFVEINLKEFMAPFMIKWMSLLMFGYESEKELEVDLTEHKKV